MSPARNQKQPQQMEALPKQTSWCLLTLHSHHNRATILRNPTWSAPLCIPSASESPSWCKYQIQIVLTMAIISNNSSNSGNNGNDNHKWTRGVHPWCLALATVPPCWSRGALTITGSVNLKHGASPIGRSVDVFISLYYTSIYTSVCIYINKYTYIYIYTYTYIHLPCYTLRRAFL